MSILSRLFRQPVFVSLDAEPSRWISTDPAMAAEIRQLKFLLASAPMIDVPPNTLEARTFTQRVVSTPFAYIHPKTMAKLTFEPLRRSFIVFPGSKTKWVLTSLMPEGRVLFSPVPMPGIEKILAQ
jgi:hypothetical protein